MGRKKVLTKEEREAKNLKKNSKKSKIKKTPKKFKKRALNKLLKEFKEDDYSCPKYGIIKHKKK